jgi:tetratricopeptide (TPR) repeat protein
MNARPGSCDQGNNLSVVLMTTRLVSRLSGDTAARAGRTFGVAAMAAFLSTSPALAQSGKDRQDCEQMTNPGLKVSACTRMLNGNPANDIQVLARHHRGVGYLLQTDYDRSILEFNQALRLDPTYKRSLNSRGNAWKGKGELDLAIADYNEAIRVDPAFAFPYNGRASAYYNLGDFDRAIADYSEVIRLDPSLAPPYHNRGLAWREKGEFDRALADINEALRRDPKSTAIYAGRGETWRRKGDLERALSDQDQAIRLDSQSPMPFLVRGDTYRYKGELNRALADYDHALRTHPDYIPAFVGRGLTFEKQGNIARARAEYEKALNSKSQFRGDVAKSSLETARARLAAFDSGAPQPVIPSAPARASSETAIPTPEIAAPVAPAPGSIIKRGRRIALIIGNSAYRTIGPLRNPQRDAESVAASLRAVGFDTVAVVHDATRDKLNDALRAFAQEAERADWAMVYYSGHGMEMNGVNYLVPTDLRFGTDREVQAQAVALDLAMRSVDGAKKLKLIVLDACRDNPFATQAQKVQASAAVMPVSTGSGPAVTRSVGRGLGAVKVSGATLVVYAAKHGQVALDGEGSNSPFAIALVQRLATPNVEINKLFRLVRDDVMEATAGRQEPYTYGSLPGREDFFFLQK